MTPPSPPAPPPPLLQRVGVAYFSRRAQALPPVQAQDAVHELNPQERRALMSVERWAIARAALAGAASAGASALAEVWADPLLPEGTPLWSSASVVYWGIVGGVTAVAAVIELVFLYWDTLRSVHQLAHVAGLEVFGPNRTASDKATAEALARAALELPNPIDGPHRINARRESSRALLVVASLAYKAKVGVSNFLFKLLLRRLLARVMVRSTLNTLLPFIAVPVTAVWNGVVSWLVMREARLRAMGPSAAVALVDAVFDDVPPQDEAARVACARAVAAAIVRTQDLHPNLVAVLDAVMRRTGDVGNAELDDVGAFLDSLPALSPTSLAVVLRLLAVACVIDGTITRRERKLFGDALSAVGRPLDFAPLERLRRRFATGAGVDLEALRAV